MSTVNENEDILGLRERNNFRQRKNLTGRARDVGNGDDARPTRNSRFDFAKHGQRRRRGNETFQDDPTDSRAVQPRKRIPDVFVG